MAGFFIPFGRAVKDTTDVIGQGRQEQQQEQLNQTNIEGNQLQNQILKQQLGMGGLDPKTYLRLYLKRIEDSQQAAGIRAYAQQVRASGDKVRADQLDATANMVENQVPIGPAGTFTEAIKTPWQQIGEAMRGERGQQQLDQNSPYYGPPPAQGPVQTPPPPGTPSSGSNAETGYKGPAPVTFPTITPNTGPITPAEANLAASFKATMQAKGASPFEIARALGAMGLRDGPVGSTPAMGGGSAAAPPIGAPPAPASAPASAPAPAPAAPAAAPAADAGAPDLPPKGDEKASVAALRANDPNGYFRANPMYRGLPKPAKAHIFLDAYNKQKEADERTAAAEQKRKESLKLPPTEQNFVDSYGAAVKAAQVVRDAARPLMGASQTETSKQAMLYWVNKSSPLWTNYFDAITQFNTAAGKVMSPHSGTGGTTYLKWAGWRGPGDVNSYAPSPPSQGADMAQRLILNKDFSAARGEYEDIIGAYKAKGGDVSRYKNTLRAMDNLGYSSGTVTGSWTTEGSTAASEAVAARWKHYGGK